MDKNFRTRVSVGVGMFIVAIIALYTFDAIPFKIIYALFAIVAMIELLSFFKNRGRSINFVLAFFEVLFLILSVFFVAKVDASHFWYIILGVPGYDIFAYFFGKLFGGRLFKERRPFPRISKNKTWEGTILGLSSAILMVLILMLSRGTFSTEWFYLLCGPLALVGDLFESYLKRRFKIKDSNEILIKNKFFSWLELLVGGSKGHGGFLDRIDSTAFACSIILVISSFL